MKEYLQYWPYFLFHVIAIFILIYWSGASLFNSILLSVLSLFFIHLMGCDGNASIGPSILSNARSKKAKKEIHPMALKCVNLDNGFERCENIEVICYQKIRSGLSCFKIEHYQSEHSEFIDKSLKTK